MQALCCMCFAFLTQLQVGVEFEASMRMQDTTTSFGYQLDLPKANLLFKGEYKHNHKGTSLSNLRHYCDSVPDYTIFPRVEYLGFGIKSDGL